MIGTLRFLWRASFTIACILIITPLMGLTWCLQARRTTRRIMRTAFHLGSMVYGIRIRTIGQLSRARPLIIVSNHFSYLDLFVLGSRIEAAFTPKNEIRSWRIIGFMCKVAGCLFIDRRAMRTLENKHMLARALAAGDIISLFPEGTTSEGKGLLPFKTALFGLAKENNVDVQPVSIVYTKLNGKPVDAAALSVVGWYGESYFFPHAAHFMRQKNLEAVMTFHPVIRADEFKSRKELAGRCRSVIEEAIAKVLASEEKKTPLDKSRGVKPNNGG